MKMRIRKHSQAEWLIMYVFVLPFFVAFLTDILMFPPAIKYTIDLVLVLLVFIMYMNRRSIENPQVARIMWVAVLFIIATIVGLVLNFQSIIYYLWGLRNNIRFFLFFLLCTMIVKRDSAERCIQLMDSLFYINVAVALYQCFVLDLQQDHIGGIFGRTKGCDAYSNMYLIIISALHMLRYMNKKESLFKCITRCGLSLFLAAIAEIKIFFVEFVVITLIAMLMTRFSARKFWLAICAVFGMMIGLRIFAAMFPNFADFFDLNNMVESASSDRGYTQSGDLNRLTAITISWSRFLNTWPQKLFGLGLGNCDYSSNFDFLVTPFYSRYKNLNYVWFMSSFLILETGLIGLSLYLFFFIRVYRAVKKVEKSGTQNPIYCQLARIMALMTPLLVIYNVALRGECAYMFYFVLALPFIQQPSADRGQTLQVALENQNGGSQ